MKKNKIKLIRKYVQRKKEAREKIVNNFWYSTISLVLKCILVVSGITYLAITDFFLLNKDTHYSDWIIFFIISCLVIKILVDAKKYSICYFQKRINLKKNTNERLNTIFAVNVVLLILFMTCVGLSIPYREIEIIKFISFVVQAVIIGTTAYIINTNEKRIKN
jgi:hypothetical protein